MIQNIPLARLETIMEERERTMNDSNFQSWLRELRVGLSVAKHYNRAPEVMSQWTSREGTRNSFKGIVARLK